MVSRKLRETIKLHKQRAYQIAFEAGIHPSTLSKIMNGIDRVKFGDQRVLAVGRVLGIPDKDLFDDQG